MSWLPMNASRHPEYADFHRRLRTFTGFPQTCTGVFAHAALADAGLFFTGTNDETVCFHCGGKLLGWQPAHDPYNEHARVYPSCEFIQTKLCERSLENRLPHRDDDVSEPMTEGDDGGYYSIHSRSDASIPIRNHHEGTRGLQTVTEDTTMHAQQSPFRAPDVCGYNNAAPEPGGNVHRKNRYTVPHSRPAFPHYATLASREDSFLTYPSGAKGNREKMAKSGFFYTGIQDRTTCFQCGNSLCSWVDEDDPLVEHARWFPDCSYVELKLGEEAISNVVETHRNLLAERQAREQSLSDHLTEPILRDLMRAPLVHRLLQQSIDPSIMELAIRKRLNDTGMIDVLEERDLRSALADVVSLPENVKAKEVSLTETGNLSKCVICTTAYRNCIFLPCSHLVTCTDCAAQCPACPTCKRQVATRRNVFLA
ncbi:baculoviral IAP repeat-containing protein 3-like [Ornithodoros turicata]|uniref:baculoviral IAP repeat-containing protein 3-like n=1 Tax=Ornithodoros turicata TaxID=34597 RepID=UPI003138DE70